jgi:Cys-rich four helix bundle protein (predicted Tat secretion target)
MSIEDTVLDRRTLIGSAAALAAAGIARGAYASDHAHADHHSKHEKLARAALDCVATGDACVAHCLAEMRAGSTELAGCASAVEELVAACRALSQLAALDSAHLARFAAATAEVCKACETECRKHEKHAPCKACAEACKRCIEECKTASA